MSRGCQAGWGFSDEAAACPVALSSQTGSGSSGSPAGHGGSLGSAPDNLVNEINLAEPRTPLPRRGSLPHAGASGPEGTGIRAGPPYPKGGGGQWRAGCPGVQRFLWTRSLGDVPRKDRPWPSMQGPRADTRRGRTPRLARWCHILLSRLLFSN